MRRQPALVHDPLSAVATPCVVIDRQALLRNMRTLADWAAEAGLRLRPHFKSHKCSQIARLQISHGAVGICCQTVGEAEAAARGGIRDILVTNEVVHPAALDTLARLARDVRIGLCFDHKEQVRRAAVATETAGSRIDAYVEVDVGGGRCGVRTADEAVALADMIARHAGLRWHGLQAYHSSAQHLRSPEERRQAAADVSGKVAEVRSRLAERGLDVEIVTGAGTGTFAAEAAAGALGELQCGSYIFMDADYGRNDPGNGPTFGNSLFVAATVISARPGQAVVDAGLKSMSFDSGLPEVFGRPGVVYRKGSDEHGVLDTGAETLAPGDRIMLIPGHCDPTIALHDVAVLVQDGVVDDVWQLDGRGPR